MRDVRTFTTRRQPYWSAPEQWRLLPFLTAHRGGPVYVYEPRRHRWAPWADETRCEALLRRAGVARDTIVTWRDCPREPLEHAVTHLLRVAAQDPPALAGPPAALGASPRPELALEGGEVEQARQWLAARQAPGEELVVLQTVARRRNRSHWPAERWRQVVRSLLASAPATRILLTGTPSERRQLEDLAARCTDARVSATVELGLRPLFAVLSLSSCVISLDTGPAHAAAALGRPLVVLAGRADPRRHRPLGPGPVEVVTGLAHADWPRDPQDWWDRYQSTAVAPEHVVWAWRVVTGRT